MADFDPRVDVLEVIDRENGKTEVKFISSSRISTGMSSQTPSCGMSIPFRTISSSEWISWSSTETQRASPQPSPVRAASNRLIIGWENARKRRVLPALCVNRRT